MQKKLLLSLALVGLLTLPATTAFASGFAIIEQSVSGLGNAFAGGAAVAEDASAIYFNPATLTLLNGQQITSALHVIIPSAKLKKESAINRNSLPISEAGSAEGGKTALVPNLYYANNLGNGWALGLGINAPFGLTTDYDRSWVGRYHAVESDVMTININPSVAYKVNDQFSLGGGISVQYIEATLSSMVDATGAASTAQDIFVENKADDWSLGFNLGAIYQASASTRIATAYRSEVKHELKGDTRTEVPAAIAAAPVAPGVTLGDLFQNQGVNGKIDLPASASISILHQLSEKLTILGDVSWTGWSSFKELTFNYEGAGIGGNTSSTTIENWEDSWRYSIGATYQQSAALKLRCGLAYDQTPIPDAAHRTPRIPGEDRTWLALGAGYKFSERLSGDVAYAHLFVPNAKIDASNNLTSAGSLVGEFENSVDIASVQLSYSF